MPLVEVGQPLGLAVQTRVLDGDGGVFGEERQHIHIALVEHALGRTGANRKDADHPALPPNRHAYRRPDAAHDRIVEGQLHLATVIVDDDWAPQGIDLPANADTFGEVNVEERWGQVVESLVANGLPL